MEQTEKGEGYYIIHFAGDPAKDIYEACPACGGLGCLGACPVCKGKGYLVVRELSSKGGNMAVSLVTAEEINAAMVSVENDFNRAGLEYGPGGELVQVHTPWACGFVEKEEHIVDF